MKKIIIFMLVVVLSICPSVASFAADETTEIQESLPIPNPGPPTPEPQIDPPTPPEPTPKNPSSDPVYWDKSDVGGGTNDGLESGLQMPDLGDSQSDEVEDSQYQPDLSEDETWNWYTSPEAELLVRISADQLAIKEDIRRNQLETQKAIKGIKLTLFLTNLWLIFRLIITPIVGYLERKRNGNQEETDLDYSEPSFDPDMDK